MRRRAGLARAASWLLALSTLLAAGLLIVQSVRIQEAGAFSREIVRARLGGLAWAGIFWLALAGVTRLLQLPGGNENPPEPEEVRLRLMRIRRTDDMRGEERRRRMARGICTGVCAVCAGRIIWYLTEPASFASRELERTVGRMLLHIAPWTLIGFVSAGICECFCVRSLRREIGMATRSKQTEPEALSRVGRTQSERNAEGACGGKASCGEACTVKTAGRIAVLVLAMTLLALGIANGGMRDVLVKAINICTECIGLG